MTHEHDMHETTQGRPTRRSRPANPARETPSAVAGTVTDDEGVTYYKRNFWAGESQKYDRPHFRMRKLAREIARVTGGGSCDLLDIGCGPGTLQMLMPPGVRYHGIDIAIEHPAPNLHELDVLANPISFDDMRFDVVVAEGLFEYLGRFQSEKFAEIADILTPRGTFIVTYTNFAHRNQQIYWPYSNVQQPEAFRADLERYFQIRRRYAGSHNWAHSQPNRAVLQALQEHLNVYVPVISPILAVDYFYVCTPRHTDAGRTHPNGAKATGSTAAHGEASTDSGGTAAPPPGAAS